MTSGLTVVTIVAGLLAGTIVYAYWLFAVAIVVVCLAFVLINREPPVTAAMPPPFRPSEFLKSFWVSPREHPDFAWAFFGRFTIYMGYQGVITDRKSVVEGKWVSVGVDLGGGCISKKKKNNHT